MTGINLISVSYIDFASKHRAKANNIKYLDENNLTENTIVIYTSDQGFYLGEHGWFDKRFMYEESLRTPIPVSYTHLTLPTILLV